MAISGNPMARTSVVRELLEGGRHRSFSATSLPRRPLVRLLEEECGLVARAVCHVLGLPTRVRSEDRRILEQVIFGYYRGHRGTHSVLYVGCSGYAPDYERSYFARHDLWTLDPAEPARRRGARQHVVAPLERLGDFFPEDYFDLIVCNGAYGYGLDSYEQCEALFGSCYTRLRPEGQLVLGWDDVPARTPVSLENLPSLKRFRKLLFPPLGTSRYLTDTACRHTYDFYCR